MKSTFKILRKNFTLNSNYMRYALRLMISCSFTVFLYNSFQNGYWAAFSVIASVFPTVGLSLQRAKQRVAGTFVGMWAGILIAHFFGTNPLYINILLPIFIFLTFYLRAYSYSFYVFFTTIVTVLFICLLIPGAWQEAIVRLGMTLIGTFIAVLATLFIFPSKASRELLKQFNFVRQSLKHYFTAICQNFGLPQKDTLQPIQLQVFKNLQMALKTVKESRLEPWYFPDKFQEHSNLYHKLEGIYQKLLILETHLPAQIQDKNLMFISKPLSDILEGIVPLFNHFDSEKMTAINQQLSKLLRRVRQQRLDAANDLSIQSVTFYEHIQETIFMETLQHLLIDLKNL